MVIFVHTPYLIVLTPVQLLSITVTVIFMHNPLPHLPHPDIIPLNPSSCRGHLDPTAIHCNVTKSILQIPPSSPSSSSSSSPLLFASSNPTFIAFALTNSVFRGPHAVDDLRFHSLLLSSGALTRLVTSDFSFLFHFQFSFRIPNSTPNPTQIRFINSDTGHLQRKRPSSTHRPH